MNHEKDCSSCLNHESHNSMPLSPCIRYHYNDNRVLPPSVSFETADAEDWWRKPEYIINDLNLNSAITHPVRYPYAPTYFILFTGWPEPGSSFLGLI